MRKAQPVIILGIYPGEKSPPEIPNYPSPKIWQCEKFGQLILASRSIDIVAIRCQILRLKCTKFDFLTPLGELTALRQTS